MPYAYHDSDQRLRKKEKKERKSAITNKQSQWFLYYFQKIFNNHISTSNLKTPILLCCVCGGPIYLSITSNLPPTFSYSYILSFIIRNFSNRLWVPLGIDMELGSVFLSNRKKRQSFCWACSLQVDLSLIKLNRVWI